MHFCVIYQGVDNKQNDLNDANQNEKQWRRKKQQQTPSGVWFVHTQCKMPEKYPHFAVCGVEWIAGKLQKSMAKQTKKNNNANTDQTTNEKNPYSKEISIVCIYSVVFSSHFMSALYHVCSIVLGNK